VRRPGLPFLMIKTNTHSWLWKKCQVPRPTYSPQVHKGRIHVSCSYSIGTGLAKQSQGHFLKDTSSLGLLPGSPFTYGLHTDQQVKDIHYSHRGFGVSVLVVGMVLDRPVSIYVGAFGRGWSSFIHQEIRPTDMESMVTL
jgi:hypothetical protein